MVANEVVDSGGISYVFRICEDTGASSLDAVRAYTAASAILDLPALFEQIERWAPNTVVSDAMTVEVRRVLDRLSRWLLSHRPQPLAIGSEITRYRRDMSSLTPRVPDLLRGIDAEVVRTRSEDLVQLGAEPEHATTIMSLLHAFCAMDIIDIADITDRPVDEVADLYFALNAHLGIDHILTAISGLDGSEKWSALARLALREDVYTAMRALCLDVLSISTESEPPMVKISEWESTNTSRLARTRAVLDEVFTPTNVPDVSRLTVAARQLRTMVAHVRTTDRFDERR